LSIPAGNCKFVFSGHLGSGEIFNYGFFVGGYTLGDITTGAAATIKASTGFVNFLASTLPAIATSDGYSGFDMYFYNGGTAAAATSHVAMTDAGTGTSPHPKQIAACLTLRTATATANGRGRLYVPYTGGAVTSAGLLDSTITNNMVDKLASWLNFLRAGTVSPNVVSQTTGVARPITSVDADYIPDTQRRRRGRLTSARHAASV
jgi:hypothetical protein